ncbi:MBL fold metallo-hydrolase [Kribbella sp. NPDC056861]|uniref:MBL fold metallo-hydrolase n=1 Tax=Kribbella sp. NPDC056861 TaxID=3154857 RepID=UPI0034317EFE
MTNGSLVYTAGRGVVIANAGQGLLVNTGRAWAPGLVVNTRVLTDATVECLPEAPPHVPVIASQRTDNELRQGFCPAAVAAAVQETFDDVHRLTVGDLEVELIEAGPAHALGDTVVWLPADRVLITGDLLRNGVHLSTVTGSPSAWRDSCDRLLRLEPNLVVPGQGPPGGAQLLGTIRDYLARLCDVAATCHAAGMPLVDASASIIGSHWPDWAVPENLVKTVAARYRELGAEDATTLHAMIAFDRLSDGYRSPRRDRGLDHLDLIKDRP